MNPLIPHTAVAAAALPLGAYNFHQVARKSPGAAPAGEALEQLAGAMRERIDHIAPGRTQPTLGLGLNVPPEGSLIDAVKRGTADYASNQDVPDVKNGYNIRINPNADRSYFAHELGHVTSAQTDIGGLIRSARGNKALTRSLAAAAILGGTGLSAMEAGDEDLDTAVALTYAAAIPEIADEILATKNGLAIMDTAGMRATLGQRGKLAAGLLSYLGAPLLLGASTNLVGNQFDENV